MPEATLAPSQAGRKAKVGGDVAVRALGQRETDLARIGVRRPGGQPGNSNRLIHGRRSAAAIERRAAGAAGRKAAGLILARLDLLHGYRHRPRPIRLDQRRHLNAAELAMLARLGVSLPGPG